MAQLLFWASCHCFCKVLTASLATSPKWLSSNSCKLDSACVLYCFCDFPVNYTICAICMPDCCKWLSFLMWASCPLHISTPSAREMISTMNKFGSLECRTVPFVSKPAPSHTCKNAYLDSCSRQRCCAKILQPVCFNVLLFGILSAKQIVYAMLEEGLHLTCFTPWLIFSMVLACAW